MQRNLGAACQLCLNSLNNNSPLISFDEWPKQNYYFTNTQKVNLPSSSSLQTERAASSPTYYAIPGTSVETRETQENTSTQAGTNELSAPEKKKRERSSESQAKTLVYLWKEQIRDLQTSKQHLIWIKIKTATNKKGPERTLKQLKDKIRNLKDAYKAARDNNKKTGASPTYSPYFEDFDEVLGTRDVINTPFAREVGVLNQDDISDDGVITGNAASSTDPGGMTPSSLDENSELKGTKKRKKRAHNNDVDQASYQEKILAVQKKQLENQVAQEERQMQFFQKFLDEQRKLEVEEREKDWEFFLQLSTILKDK